MINKKETVSMSEAMEYVDKNDDGGKEVIGFMKKFVKINEKKAKELRNNLKGLDLMKVKDEDISKIIENMPETNEELNKIFVDVSLDEDETKKILDSVKEFK